MSKTVTIPTGGGNPFVVILGGVKYVYKPGETVEVPDGVALEIEEWERWHKKYYGENEPPFGAQPDWNQNDENAPDYVKNRTHWEDEDGTVHKLDPKYLPDAADTADYQERTHWDTRETKEVTFFEETIEMNFSNTTYPCEQEIHYGDTVNIYIDGELKHTVTCTGSATATYINPSPDFSIVITNADHAMDLYNGQYSGLCRLDVVTEIGELKQLDEKYIPVKNSITVITIDGNYASMGYNEIMERVNKGEVVIVHSESDLFFYCGDNNEAKHAYFSQLSAHTRKVNYCRIYQDAAWDINSFTLATT